MGNSDTPAAMDRMTETFPPSFVPYEITICGLAELCEHSRRGVTHVVSILDPEHPDPEDFAAYLPHRRVLWRFDDVVHEIEGATAPGERDVRAILDLGEELRAERVEHLLIHCHAGISRSTATAVILMAQNAPGREVEVFVELSRIRPQSWPNSRMVRIADELLGRGGALSNELIAHHRRVAGNHPELARAIARFGRAHEVPDLDQLLRG